MSQCTRSLFLAVGLALGACSDSAYYVYRGPDGRQNLVNVDANGLALQGYDPVGYFDEGRPVKGDAAIRAEHEGASYYFASAAHRDAFVADPGRYTPQFGGFCGYAASIDKISPISVEYFQVLDGRLVLQHNEKAWTLWNQDVPGNLQKADANWPGLVARNAQ